MNGTHPSNLSNVTPAQWRQQRFNPLASITPQLLGLYIDSFDRGYLRSFALAAHEIMERDDVLASVVPKRKRYVAGQPWEILIGEEVPEGQKAEAEAQQQVLKQFYSTLVCKNAVELDEQGGIALLVRRMMEAQFLRYSCAEIVWNPQPDGLQATLYYTPLEFFDSSLGAIRYAGVNGNTPGEEIDKTNWLIAVSDGCIMKAAAVCYMFKRLSLADWLNFSGKFGIPAIHGKTEAAYGSPEWDQLVQALPSFANDFTIVTSRDTDIQTLSATASGDGPFQPMVDRMDRAMVRLVMGSDLATMSRENGTGASLQDKELNTLIRDDCKWISELFNEQLSRRVLQWQFGEDVTPLAFFELRGPQDKEAKLEMEIDKHVREFGVNLDPDAVAERWGRENVAPTPEQIALRQQQQQAAQKQQPEPEPPPAANEAVTMALAAKSNHLYSTFKKAVHADLEPLRNALMTLENAKSADEMRGAILTISAELPAIEMQVMAGNATADALGLITAAEMLSALAHFRPINPA